MDNQFYNQDSLAFGSPQPTSQLQPSKAIKFDNVPTKQNKQHSNVKFKEASKKVSQQKIDSVQKVRPSSAQKQEKFKPSWNDKVEAKPKQFDNLKKNEIFKIETKLQKEKIEREKENKKRQLENPPPAAVKSYATIKDIETQYKKDVSEMKKQKRELEQLQWMIDQEKKLKAEQNKQFEEKLRQMKTQQHPDMAQDIMNAKKKGMENKESPYKTKEQKKQDKKKQLEKNVDDIYVEPQQNNYPIWKDGIQLIHYEAKKPLLPGEYDQNDLDLIPQKQPQQQPQQVRIDDNKLKNELIEIQKRELQRQHELDALIDKHQQLLRSEAQNPNKHYKEINEKLDKIKGKVDPLVKKIDSVQIEYPFTGHLLARGVSKMIQVHSERLTELLIDDLLFEMVDILDTLEMKKKEEERQRYEQMALCDYIEAVKDIALDQDKVEQNFQQTRQQFMRDTRLDQYVPVEQLGRDQQFYINPMDRFRSIELSSGFIIKIMEDRKRRIQYVTQDKQYYPKNLEQFDLITEAILEEIIWERAAALYQSSDEMAEQIFINEFK
ncbi:unnamed protein product (macronuclear) [Paramecium tetraurelia]|uniref:Uncharacterized protein n=1 Tax=Paramecium tetraurelia TaxID=5888 RepID=A0DLM8_PARTE|nr:uncharacterized protein GSPATT00039577001 [Paramecium tetraurelia]CAK83945.1 unnamed protein product [Paramecium tetraurelia]|eukprot:XP_001451342.1 hypothetical protein (macronuclear) [Paramecium tetraurelia strain d4-2]